MKGLKKKLALLFKAILSKDSILISLDRNTKKFDFSYSGTGEDILFLYWEASQKVPVWYADFKKQSCSGKDCMIAHYSLLKEIDEAQKENRLRIHKYVNGKQIFIIKKRNDETH